MSFEDDLRAIMHDHDHEAPTREVLRAQRRSFSWLPVAAAAAVVLAVAATVAVVAHRETGGAPPAVAASPAPGGPLAPTSPLRCPTTEPRGSEPAQQVPASPTVAGAADRLVPNAAPRSVLVCGWVQGKSHHAVLTGDSTQLIAELALAPRAQETFCADYLAGTDGDHFLLGLSYAKGTVWVAAPGNHCDGSSNGRFTSALNLRADAAAALASGTWAPQPRPGGSCGNSVGRLGQEQQMVPDGATSMTVCVTRGGGHAQTTTIRSVSDFAALVAALNRAATKPSRNMCDGTPTSAATYTLIFGYPRGPSVVVRVLPFCTPSIDNGSLSSSKDGSVLRELQRALKR